MVKGTKEVSQSDIWNNAIYDIGYKYFQKIYLIKNIENGKFIEENDESKQIF